jgi:SAM-dependent methyltransferase
MELGTALVFNGRLALPSGWAGRAEPDAVALTVAGPGVAVIRPARPAEPGALALGEAGLRIPPRRMTELGWSAGEAVAFEPASGGLLARRIDRRAHPGFAAPARDAEGLPVPPGWLMQAFTSTPNVESGLANGRRSAALLRDIAARHGVALGPGSVVLDFGSGCARVARFIPGATGGAAVIGVDLHRDAVAWCRRHMPFGTWLEGEIEPPLPLADGAINAMLALSVLTHLDEGLCGRWLAEWRRLLRPGGVAVVTYHGEGLIRARVPAGSPYAQDIARQWAARGGVAFLDNKAWAGIFPDAYQTSYHSDDHVRREWGRHFEVLELIPSGGFTNLQDVAVLRRAA